MNRTGQRPKQVSFKLFTSFIIEMLASTHSLSCRSPQRYGSPCMYECKYASSAFVHEISIDNASVRKQSFSKEAKGLNMKKEYSFI